MSNRLDDRIRALIVDLVESAPEAPPFPLTENIAGRESRPVRSGQRLALATLVLVLIVGSAVGITNLVSVGRDSSDASATTPASSATSGPTSTVTGADTNPATTASPATTSSAAETTSAPTAPPDPRAAAVAALEIQCPSFAQTLTPLFEQVAAPAEEYGAVLDSLDGELFGLWSAVAILGSGDEFERLTTELDAVTQQVQAARFAGITEADKLLPAVDTALTDLASSLVSFGVTPCDSLANVIP